MIRYNQDNIFIGCWFFYKKYICVYTFLFHLPLGTLIFSWHFHLRGCLSPFLCCVFSNQSMVLFLKCSVLLPFRAIACQCNGAGICWKMVYGWHCYVFHWNLFKMIFIVVTVWENIYCQNVIVSLSLHFYSLYRMFCCCLFFSYILGHKISYAFYI